MNTLLNTFNIPSHNNTIMGNTTSTTNISNVNLSNKEKELINEHFQTLNKLGGNNFEKGIQQFCDPFPTPVSQSLQKLLMCFGSNGNTLNEQNYLDQLSLFLKGSPREQGKFLEILFSQTDLYTFVKVLSQIYFNSWELSSLPLTYLDEWTEFIISYHFHKLLRREEIEASELADLIDKTKRQDTDINNIIQSNQMLYNFILATITNILLPDFKLPSLKLPLQNTSIPKSNSQLLDKSLISMLQQFLPEDCDKLWRNLYHSKIHGKSWNRFQSEIENQGSTVIIIQDKDGHIFGCFNYMDWKVNPKFYGDSKSFLFSVYPTMRIHFSTNYNTNYMYLNHGAQTLPNGLGMGGQLNYFGLYLDEKLESGHSMANPYSSTYYSPQLSKSPKFEIEHVEVYQVREPPKDEDEVNHGGKSILDTNPDAMAILEMADKPMYSKFVRDPDLDI